MFDYITIKDTALKWGISERRIQKLCEENRIPGVIRLGLMDYSTVSPKTRGYAAKKDELKNLPKY